MSEIDHCMLLKRDVIGEEPQLEMSPLLHELDSMVGLEKVLHMAWMSYHRRCCVRCEHTTFYAVLIIGVRLKLPFTD